MIRKCCYNKTFVMSVITLCMLVLTISVAYAIRDQATEFAPTISLLNKAYTSGTNNGTGVDLGETESATILIDFGTWTDGTHKIQIEESSDNASWSTVAASEISGATVSIATSTYVDNAVYWFGYLGDQRYIRVSSYISGSTSSGAIYSGIVLRGRLTTMPHSTWGNVTGA